MQPGEALALFGLSRHHELECFGAGFCERHPAQVQNRITDPGRVGIVGRSLVNVIDRQLKDPGTHVIKYGLGESKEVRERMRQRCQ